MGVFFRTGENSAASFSWPVYLFVIAPLQFIGLMVKGFYYIAVGLAIAVMFVYRFGRDRWEARGTS